MSFFISVRKYQFGGTNGLVQLILDSLELGSGIEC